MSTVANRRFARTLSHLPAGTDHQAAAHAFHIAGATAATASVAASAPTSPELQAGARPFVDREHFERHGYCIVRDMLTEEDLAKVETDYDVLVNQRAQRWLEMGYLSTTHGDKTFDKRLAAIAADLPPRIQESELRPFLHEMDTMSARCKGTFEFFFSEGLLAAVEQLIGPEITLNPIQHIRPYIPHRFAGGYGSTTWHQDQAVTQEEADGVDIVTCWIPFTTATRENGALRILKNVARDKALVIGHHEDDKVAALWPGGEPVDCLLNRGDAVFISAYALRYQLVCLCQRNCSRCYLGFVNASFEFTGTMSVLCSYTPHRGTLNSSDTVRWSMDLRFQRTGTPTGRPAHPAFVLQSRENPSSVQDSFDEWCHRWVEGIENVRSGKFPHGHRKA